MKKSKFLFCTLLFVFLSHIGAFQLEGGLNYNFKSWNYFASADFFLWSTVRVEKPDENTWMGYALNLSYENENIFISPMFGTLEFLPDITKTIFIGPKFGTIDYKKIGISLKGSTYMWQLIPFSLIVDPKYDFGENEFIWDFKCSIGIGKFIE
ncbi:MAG: hypothetical protein HQK83_11980 [Fibrobacteria bacterium]|nr:hypothetical protein [Fibrobacteria bacterium]